MTPARYFIDTVPDSWFVGDPEVLVDREEILVVGDLPADVAPRAFRETTRDQRIAIAAVAERAFERTVTWAVRVEGELVRFTTVSVPVMTRLRIEERQVLDLLIEGGVARSRSEALAWCVRLVHQNEAGWLGEIAEAADRLAEIRGRGPDC
ncbi:MAG: hypothetical protein ACXIVQ_03030 [Acidimicrobiales bacterium]